MFDFTQIKQALIDLDRNRTLASVKNALNRNENPQDILEQGLIAGMEVIGDKMEMEEMFIPEVLAAADTMRACLDVIKPLLGSTEVLSKGNIVIGTVKGDLHDIGKNLVAMMLETSGFKVINLGVDIPTEDFVTAVYQNSADVLCLSALLTTTMPVMKDVINSVRRSTSDNRVKVLIGGAPVSQDYANKIGADGYAPDAASAVKAVKSLLHRNK
ncbi:MAG: corrinoid protein [Thermodesulfobacteriota bacterium]